MCNELILAFIYFSTIFCVNFFLLKLLQNYLKTIFFLVELKQNINGFLRKIEKE
jgi:hypothetical protein